MKRPLPVRFRSAAALLLSAAASPAAQTQQVAPPSATPVAAASSLPTARPTGAIAQPAAPPLAEPRVAVSYAQGQLAVVASNASLNEILRQVAQKTGMKITGGVEDDRVFGSYGPSTPALVLDALLEGTGSNILLVDGPGGGSELVLTPRHGGPTPPNPNAGRQNEAEENVGGGYVPPVRPYQAPSVPIRGQFGLGGPDAQVSAPGGSAAPGQASEPDSSAGPRTPQEVYEQLQQTMQRHSTPPPQ